MKKINVLTILGILLVSAIVFSVPPTAAVVVPEAAAENTDPFLVGTTSLAVDLDPQYSWDSASSDINNQIWDGLYAYSLGDPSLRMIPRLAADCGNWSADAKTFTVKLREGITYHDGYPFNASCVVDSFDRLYQLCVFEDDQVAELYFPKGMNLTAEDDPEGYTNSSNNYGYVINNIEIINDFEVAFHLNYPYVPFHGLLCFSASFIMHPKEPDTYLAVENINNGTAIGTGPYMATSASATEIVLDYNPDYFRGTPSIRKIKFVKYSDSGAIGTAFLNSEVQIGTWNPDMLQQFIDSPDHTVEGQLPNTIIRYMGYNNKLIDREWRKAMNMAIDYDYINDEICQGTRARMTSVVPAGINYHIDCAVAEFDSTYVKPRQYLVDNIDDLKDDYGLDMSSPDQDWIDVAETDPLASFSYTYNLGNEVRADIGLHLKDSFRHLGIQIMIQGITWAQFVGKMHGNPDSLDLYMVGWMADYNDASNYINPLMSNTSAGNAAQINDHTLQLLIDAGVEETDKDDRQKIYEDIQHYVAEELEPWAFMGVGFGYGVRLNTVIRQRNAMGYLYFFPWGWNDINTTYTPEELLFQEMWCSAEQEDIPVPYWPPEEERVIPGYSMFVLLGVVAATIVAIIKKRK